MVNEEKGQNKVVTTIIAACGLMLSLSNKKKFLKGPSLLLAFLH